MTFDAPRSWVSWVCAVSMAAFACTDGDSGNPYNWPPHHVMDPSTTPDRDAGARSPDDDVPPPTHGQDSGRPPPPPPPPPDRDAGSDGTGSTDAGAGGGASDAEVPGGDEPADASTDPDPEPDAGTGGGRILPPVTSTDADGPFKATIDEGRDNWVFRPTELGKDGLKHPVFVWGTGSTAVPRQYTDHFTRMASHGFVIVAPTPSQLNGRLMKASLDWILAENQRPGSPYYQKLDPDRVAMGGHSQGSTSTFDVEGNETRLKTTIHIAGGSFDGSGSSKVRTPTAYICGETDIALRNCKRDFENVRNQPTFFSELAGVDHIQCARAALPAMISWLRWHLAGETERAAEFTGPSGRFHQGIWRSQTKNWSW